MTPEAARRIEADLRAADEDPPPRAAPPRTSPYPALGSIVPPYYDGGTLAPSSVPMRFFTTPTPSNRLDFAPTTPRGPRRMGSPFQFGQAVLEPRCHTLFDSLDVERNEMPAGEYRFFLDRMGKSDAQCDPYWMPGGQLSAPRMFVLHGVRVAFQVRLFDDQVYDPLAGRTDIERIKAESSLTVRVGMADYVSTAVAGLPYDCRARRVVIPPQQIFFAIWRVDRAVPLTYRWRCFVKLSGELGIEVQ
jgi:hypothetical protein